jgi:hypothetical protein
MILIASQVDGCGPHFGVVHIVYISKNVLDGMQVESSLSICRAVRLFCLPARCLSQCFQCCQTLSATMCDCPPVLRPLKSRIPWEPVSCVVQQFYLVAVRPLRVICAKICAQVVCSAEGVFYAGCRLQTRRAQELRVAIWQHRMTAEGPGSGALLGLGEHHRWP